MPKGIVQIPKRVLEEVVEAGRRFSAAEDMLEDFLLAMDPVFLKKMRRLRRGHRRGQLHDWHSFKAKHDL